MDLVYGLAEAELNLANLKYQILSNSQINPDHSLYCLDWQNFANKNSTIFVLVKKSKSATLSTLATASLDTFCISIWDFQHTEIGYSFTDNRVSAMIFMSMDIRNSRGRQTARLELRSAVWCGKQRQTQLERRLPWAHSGKLHLEAPRRAQRQLVREN